MVWKLCLTSDNCSVQTDIAGIYSEFQVACHGSTGKYLDTQKPYLLLWENCQYNVLGPHLLLHNMASEHPEIHCVHVVTVVIGLESSADKAATWFCRIFAARFLQPVRGWWIMLA